MNTDTRHLYVLNSTIFRAFDSDTDNFLSQIGVMGKSFGQISESINKRQIEIHDLMDTMSKIDAVNKTGGFWSYIFGNESGTKKPKDLSSFVDLDESEANTIIKSIQETQAKVNSGSRTWQDYLKTLHDRNEWQIKFIQNNDLQKASADDVIAANKDAYEAALHYNKGLKQLTFGAKASQAAFKGLAATGNMLLFMAIFKGAELAVKSLINYAHRLDDARKALADTETDLSSIETTIGETRVKVKELEALDPSSLSITDKEDLQRLKDQNEELRIRQQYLETQKQNNLKSVAAAAKEQYNLRYSEPVDKGSISRYKELYTAPKDAPPVSNYLTGNSALPDTPYAAGIQAKELNEESQSLSALIARYEYYEEQKKKAIQDEDTEAIAGYIAELKKISGTLWENRTELQGFFEDLSASGESGPDLDDISQKIKLIDRTLFTKGQNLFHFIDSNALKDDKKRLVDLAESGHLTEKELSKSFSNVGAYLKENGLTYEDLISVIKSYKKELQSIPDKKTNVSYSDTITTLKEMSDAFSALDNAYAGITDNSRSITFENLSELSDKFKNVAGIEKYVKAIQDAKGNAESAQKAFNNLASAYINHTGILENVNDQNKELIALYLQEQGIVNADVLVEQAYRDSKIDAMAANFSFTGSVDEQVKALTEEINCLGLTGDASIQLATAVVEAQTAISNAVFTATKGRLSNYASEIQSIKSLQEAQGTIADIKSQVQTAMGGDNWAADLGGYHGASQDIADTYNSLKTVENAYADIEEIKASLVTPPVYGKNISTVKDASGSSGNTNKFSEKLDSIDHKLELSKRRLNDYNYELEKALTVSRRNTAIDNIVRESAAQIKDLSDIYAYYSKKADEALAQIPESLREDIKNGKVGTIQIDNQNISRLIQQYYDLDSAAHDAATQIRELGQSINDMKKKKIEVQIEGLERAKSKAERIKSQYESAISAVTSSIQSEMDHVNDYYDDHTKRIQDQIDALDEQNDKLEMQNRLEQALYDIRRAENQRTSRIYREGQGFVYEADQNAVRDSRQSYDDAVFDQAKYDLQQILDGLEKERDEEIEYLSDIMDAWNGIADSFERMADVEIADDVFGGGWLDEILSGNTDLLDEMSENFGDVFGQIADSEKAIEALDNLLEQIESGELSEDNALTIMNGQISELGDNTTAQAEVMGQGYHSIYASAETAKDLSAETYAAWTENLALFQEQSLAVCNSLVSQFNSMADAIVEAVKRAKEAEKELNDSDGGRDEGSSSSGRSGSSPGGLNASMHHKGILSGTFGKSATGDDRVRELTRLSAGKLKFNEVPVIGLKDEIALTKEQQDTLLENIKNMSYPQYHIPSMDYGQFQPSGANTQNNEYVFNGGINISEAQNVTDIAKGITNGMLKQALHQELYKR